MVYSYPCAYEENLIGLIFILNMKYILRPFVRLFLIVFAIIMIFLGIVLGGPVFLFFGPKVAFNWWDIVIDWVWEKVDPIFKD